jgi:hypothetical protein
VPYSIVYARPTQRHLAFLSQRQRLTLLDAIDDQLTHKPTVRTRNRKRMRPNPLAAWELRVGALRAYYDVLAEPEPIVLILGVGIKERGILRIAGEEVAL